MIAEKLSTFALANHARNCVQVAIRTFLGSQFRVDAGGNDEGGGGGGLHEQFSLLRGLT